MLLHDTVRSVKTPLQFEVLFEFVNQLLVTFGHGASVCTVPVQPWYGVCTDHEHTAHRTAIHHFLFARLSQLSQIGLQVYPEL